MRQILLCALVALCAGCFQKPPLDFVVPDADSRSAAGSDFPGQATVYLVRAGGSGVVISAYVDQTRQTSITEGYYAKIPVPPGKRVIALKTPPIAGMGGFVIQATFQPDRTYYFYFLMGLAGASGSTLTFESSIRQLTPLEAPAYLAKHKDQVTAPQ